MGVLDSGKPVLERQSISWFYAARGLWYERRMLQLRNVVKEFGDRRLFAGIDWHIRPGDREAAGSS